MSASSFKPHQDTQVESTPTTSFSMSTGEVNLSTSNVARSPETGAEEIESAHNIKESQSVSSNRQQPIPPPSEPMQYRAIGLVEGRYQPSEERFNRGNLLAKDGTQLEAVLLGQVMSLVKKYVDLDQDYLWVVYPRTREKEQMLHLQIVGVWSAGGFGPIAETAVESETTLSSPLSAPLEDGYFSVRGQVVYQSDEKRTLFVKIQQSARKGKERPKDFKLKLNGVLPQKAIGYFWEFHIKRQGPELEVTEGIAIAAMPVKKRPPQGGKRRPSAGAGSNSFQRPNKPQRTQRGDFTAPSGTKPSKPAQKPVRRNNTPTENS